MLDSRAALPLNIVAITHHVQYLDQYRRETNSFSSSGLVRNYIVHFSLAPLE